VIGAASGSQRLTVANTSYGFNDYLGFSDGTKSATVGLGNSSGSLVFKTGGNSFDFYKSDGTTSYLTINDTNGIVGIGTGSGGAGSARLHVQSNTASQSLLRVTDSTATAVDVLNIADEGATTFRNRTNSVSAFQIQNAAGGSLFNVDSTNTTITVNGTNSGEVQAWTTETDTLTAARFNGTSVSVNGYVYYVGGQSGGTEASNVYSAKLNADGSTNAWGSNTSLSDTRSGAAVTTANGYIYVIGGQDGTPSDTLRNTVLYAKVGSDGTIGTWKCQGADSTECGVSPTNTTNIPSAAIANGKAFTANGYIYLVGGATNTAGTTVSTAVSYAKLNADGSTGSWTTTTALPFGLNMPGLTVANGYVYVAGGIDTTNTHNSVLYAPINANGTLGSWSCQGTSAAGSCSTATITNANSLTEERRGSSVIAMNGYLYVMGGRATAAGSSRDTVYYARLNADGSTGSWTAATNVLPQASTLGTVTTANGYIYYAGGDTNAGSTATNAVYYTSLGRVKMAGSLDLVGVTGSDYLDNGSQAGSLTAGNTNVSGTLSVRGWTTIQQGLSVGDTLSVSGSAFFQNGANSTTAFQIQNAGSENVLTADTTNERVSIGNSSSTQTLTISGQADASLLTLSPGTGISTDSGWININSGRAYLGYNGSTDRAVIRGGTSKGVSILTNDSTVAADFASSGAVTFKNGTDSTTGFQIQNAASNAILNVDTTNALTTLGGNGTIIKQTLSAATPIITDDFTRGTSALGPSWTVRGGTFSVSSNKLTYTAGTGGTMNDAHYNAVIPTSADYTVQADVNFNGMSQVSTNYACVVGRRVDFSTNDSNGYLLCINNNNGELRLSKRVGAGYTNLGSAYTIPSYSTSQTYTIKLDMSGTSLTGYLDGVSRVTATDSAFSAAGDAGIAAYTNTATAGRTWDNFIVTSATSASTVLSVQNNGGANLAQFESTGRVTFRNATDSTTAFQIQNTAGNSLFTADTQNTKLTTSGNLVSSFTALNGTSTTNGTGTASTSLILNDASNFDVGNYVQVNSTACVTGVNVCYAKITAKASNTLTISPALTWANAATVNEYMIPEIGGAGTSSSLTDRFGRGYFIDGIVTGNGSTYYSDGGIQTSGSGFKIQTTGGTDLLALDASNQRLAIGPAAVAANAVLTVGTNTTTASGGLYFGTDTNLYRAAAGQLRTDGVIQPIVSSSAAWSAGLEGGIVYDDTTNKVYLYDNGAKKELCNKTDASCGGTSTLQQSYDASTSPEITVNSTNGALTIRDNSVPIAANIFEVQSNNGGTTYFGVTASGASVGGNITATGTYNSNTFTSSALTFGATGAAAIQSASGQNLSIDAGTTANLNLGTSANNKTINTGAVGTTANTTTVNIATSTGAAQTIYLGGTGTASGTSHSGSTVAVQGGSTVLNVANAGATITSYGNSATAFTVQTSGSSAILTVDASASQVLFGNASNTAGKLVVYGSNGNAITLNVGATATYSLTLPTAAPGTGQCLKGGAVTAGNLEWGTCGGSAGTKRITLVPEFQGGTLTADGSNNSGTMNADSVSGLSSGQGYKHNFYEWSTDQASGQDYDIVINYQLPSDFSSFAASSFRIWTYADSLTSTDVTFMIKDVDGTLCYTSAVSVKPTGAAAWEEMNPGNPANGCSFAANDVITFIIKPTAITAQTNKVKVGEIRFEY
jgi:hypothetical protein